MNRSVLVWLDLVIEKSIVVTDWELRPLAEKSWESSQETIEYELCRFLLPFRIEGTSFVLAGNTTNTDRTYIKKHLPLLDAFLHPGSIDVTLLASLFEAWYPKTSQQIKESMESAEPLKIKALINLMRSCKQISLDGPNPPSRRSSLLEAECPGPIVVRALPVPPSRQPEAD